MQKFDFQPSTIKPVNIGQNHPKGQICPVLTIGWPILSDFVVESSDSDFCDNGPNIYASDSEMAGKRIRTFSTVDIVVIYNF